MIAEQLKPYISEFICRPEKGKGARGIGKNWSYKRAVAELFEGQYVCAVIDLSHSDIICIDIDEKCDMTAYFEVNDFPDFLKTKGNTKGFHYYLETDDKVHKNISKVHKHNIEGDYLGMKVWERVGKEWTGDLIKSNDFKKVIEWDKVEKKTIEKNDERVYAPPDLKQLDALIQLIDIQYIHKTTDWRKLVWAMKKCGFERGYVESWSMKSGFNEYSIGYSDEGFCGVWGQYTAEDIHLTEGTIKYYAKLSQPEKYAELVYTPMISYAGMPEDEDLAGLYLKLEKNTIRMDDGALFVWANDKWIAVDKKAGIVRRKIGNVLRAYFKEDVKKFDREHTDAITRNDMDSAVKYSTLLKLATKTLSRLKTATHIANVTKTTIDVVSDMDNETSGLFDRHHDIFAFRNQAFDLNDRTEYEIQKEDYITQNCGKDWVMPEPEQDQAIDELFKKIFPDEDMRLCYLSILRSGLSGHHLERFIVANGSGRNGKGLLNELMFHLLGGYAYKLQIDTLTKSSNRTGASPEVANLHKKRFVVASEPEDGVKFQMGNIKDLTGSDEIVARGLYQESTRTILNSTLIVECNKRPQIAGRIDRAVTDRMIEVQFRNAFVSDPDEVDEERGIYLANKEYKTLVWKDKMFCALFVYILQNGKPEIYVPKSVKSITKQYILGSDELYSLVMERYVESDDPNDFIKENDIYALVRESDVYLNMTKMEKRSFNKKKVGEMLKEHIIFGKQYRNTTGYNKILKKTIGCNRLMGYVPKPDDGSDDEE